MLTRVQMPTGDDFRFFYKPEAIVDLGYFGYPGYEKYWSVLGGSRTTEGLSATHRFSDYDHSEVAREAFANLTLTAFSNNNLNNYLDTSNNAAFWEITIKFEMVVKDNDPDPDEFGEILYFERGAGDGKQLDQDAGRRR